MTSRFPGINAVHVGAFAGGACLASCLVIGAEFVKSSNPVSPALLTYVTSAILIFHLPAHLLFCFARNWFHGERRPFLASLKEHYDIFPSERTNPEIAKFVGKMLALGALWTVFGYSLLAALKFGNAFDVCGKFVAYSNFLYILCWLLLKHRFFFLRVKIANALYKFKHPIFLNSSFQIPAFLFVMIGVIFLTYPRPQYAPCDVWRCLLTMLSATCLAFYTVSHET